MKRCFAIFALVPVCLALTTQRSTAKGDCQFLERTLDAYALSQHRQAVSLNDLRSVQEFSIAYDGDPWGNPYIYEPNATPRIRSAGPDGKPHTDDDVTAQTRLGFGCLHER